MDIVIEIEEEDEDEELVVELEDAGEIEGSGGEYDEVELDGGGKDEASKDEPEIDTDNIELKVKDDLTDTIGKIEESVDGVFNVDLGDIGQLVVPDEGLDKTEEVEGAGPETSEGEEVGDTPQGHVIRDYTEESDPLEDIRGEETIIPPPSEDFVTGDLQPINGSQPDVKWGREVKVEMDESRKLVSLSTDKYVTRVPMGKYLYKESPWEIVESLIKISVPVIVVIIIFFLIWMQMPSIETEVEDFEIGIDYNLAGIKRNGLDPKIPGPFPVNSSMGRWDVVDKSKEEVEFLSGGLKEDLKKFEVTYADELIYEDDKREIESLDKELNTKKKKLEEVNEKMSISLSLKESYLKALSDDNTLDPAKLKKESDERVDKLLKEFDELEKRTKELESEIKETKSRIAKHSADGGNTKDIGYISNMNILENLNTEYNKLKPEYNRLKKEKDATVNRIREKYQGLIDNTLNLHNIEEELETLGDEKEGIEKNIDYLQNDIDSISARIKAHDKKRGGSGLKGKELARYLVMLNYINEKEGDKDSEGEQEDISFMLDYTIFKKDATVAISTVSYEGVKEERKYLVTLMRMETAKRFLFFEWDVRSTSWVLTSITEKK